MFDEVPEWSRRHILRRTVARRMCRMLLEDLRRSVVVGTAASPSRSISALRHWHWWLLRSWLERAAKGDSVVLMSAQRRLVTSRVALQLDLVTRNRARAEVDLGRCCEAIAKVERTRFLRTWARSIERDRASRAPLDAATDDFGTWEAAELDETHGVGFHTASTAGAKAVRWSEPAAYVELPLVAGRYVIRLNWLFPPLVGQEPRLRFYLDERLIPADRVAIRREFVELRVEVPVSSSLPRLGWVCPANRADGDDRKLGLPLVSVSWACEDASISVVDEQTTDGVELAHLA
jgi:hypothetical protein